MTDEIDDVQPDDATADTELPGPIVQLGIEAQAEYRRARQRLGLSERVAAQLGTVGRYRLEVEVGRGGMGVVYRARDPELDREVAIKLVQARPLAHYDRLRARLLREAKVLAKLTHPNVVRIYDCGEHEGEVYLAMEYVEGATLRGWQRDQPRRSILDAYVQAARGLAAVHELGVTHRDFKPDNVLVADDGRVLVGDFGLAGSSVREQSSVGDTEASAASEASRGSATRTGAMLGTPTYMAPEQLRGEGATSLSDQFAFCVALWEALAGRRPFEAEGGDALLEQIERGSFVDGEKISRRLRATLQRGLAADPAARFADIEALADAIEPRRSRVVLGVVLMMTLAVGLVVGRSLDDSAVVSSECMELRGALLVVEPTEPWGVLEERLDGPLQSTYKSVHDSIYGDMTSKVEDLCRQGAGSAVFGRKEALEAQIKYLAHVLRIAAMKEPSTDEYSYDLPDVLDGIEMLQNGRWDTPPRPLGRDVRRQLRRVRFHILNNDSEGALEASGRIAELAKGENLELAYAYLWRGRVLSLLQGKHAAAMTAYNKAIAHAEMAPFDSMRLNIELLVAKTAIMRLDNLGQAEGALSRAEGLLAHLDEPWISPRRADCHELNASVLKRRGNYRGAMFHQLHALLIRYAQSDVRKIGNGHVNLGIIHELRGEVLDLQLAGVQYERAFRLLDYEPLRNSPERLQAAFNLGHWLVNKEIDSIDERWSSSSPDWRRARHLLEIVSSESADLRIAALTDLLLMNIAEDNAAKAVDGAQALRTILDGESDVQPDKRLDAWQNIAIAYAMARDVEAFESAREKFGGVAQQVRERGLASQQRDVDFRSGSLDFQAAITFMDFAPGRALELAASARRYLMSLPDSQAHSYMLGKIEQLESQP